jgi:hypothetical protein
MSELEFKAELWILKIFTKLRFELQYPPSQKNLQQEKIYFQFIII